MEVKDGDRRVFTATLERPKPAQPMKGADDRPQETAVNSGKLYLSDLKAKAVIVPSDTNSPAIDVAQKQRIPTIKLSPVLIGFKN